MWQEKTFQGRKKYRAVAQHLRGDLTKAEYILWQELRREKLGHKFRRQFNIGSFIVDFYCHELRLVIELDGPIHNEQKMYDERRTNFLKKQGCTVLRYTNDKVLFHREEVLKEIRRHCEVLSAPLSLIPM